jgi:hypothetical protein
MVLLYIDPGSMMPVGSALAAAFGIVLIFWNWVVRSVKAVIQFVRVKLFGDRATETVLPRESTEPSAPESR